MKYVFGILIGVLCAGNAMADANQAARNAQSSLGEAGASEAQLQEAKQQLAFRTDEYQRARKSVETLKNASEQAERDVEFHQGQIDRTETSMWEYQKKLQTEKEPAKVAKIKSDLTTSKRHYQKLQSKTPEYQQIAKEMKRKYTEALENEAQAKKELDIATQNYAMASRQSTDAQGNADRALAEAKKAAEENQYNDGSVVGGRANNPFAEKGASPLVDMSGVLQKPAAPARAAPNINLKQIQDKIRARQRGGQPKGLEGLGPPGQGFGGNGDLLNDDYGEVK